MQRLKTAGLLAVAGAFGILACGDSTGVVSECPGAKTVRLHFVNISDTPNLSVSATYGTMTCGPVDLPVSTDQGLELAQLLIEGDIGDVITVQVTTASANGASAQCEITEAATPQVEENRLQTFANVSGGPPVEISCAEGLQAVP